MKLNAITTCSTRGVSSRKQKLFVESYGKKILRLTHREFKSTRKFVLGLTAAFD